MQPAFIETSMALDQASMWSSFERLEGSARCDGITCILNEEVVVVSS